jgi:exosortase/archaeosortase family protein
LFTFFLVLDWKAINPKKAVFLYFFGTVVMFTVNIIRVYLVLLMGNIINPEFAMKGFHENIGWVLFTIVFIIFEYLTYSWMRK